jgi:hypothetical protein
LSHRATSSPFVADGEAPRVVLDGEHGAILGRAVTITTSRRTNMTQSSFVLRMAKITPGQGESEMGM